MINNDSIVTAYDEHLTLVEWLQKIEKLLANGGLKSTTLNDKGNATFSLTLTFNDDTTITSPDMTLTSVNEALTALTGDISRIDGGINQLNINFQALDNSVEDIKDGTTHLFENITDKNGNKRFIEGNITMEAIEGITQTYGKWSLSGTHLMIVVVLDIASDVTTPINATLAKFSLPDYIYDKIPTIWGTTANVISVIVRDKIAWYNNPKTWSTIPLYKANNQTKQMEIKTSGSYFTTTAESACRIQFDLIIDNE